MRESARLRQLKLRNIDEIKDKKTKKKKEKKARSRVQRGSYAEKLHQAGILMPPSIWVVLVSAISIFLGISFSRFIGSVVGISVGLATGVYCLTTLLSVRAEKRRYQVVPQLPGFIDTLAASLSTGFNMETAIEHATGSLPPGVLKKEFSTVVKMLHKGITLDESLDLVVRRIAGQEIVSIVVTVRLFYGMGGRVVSPFRRLGTKMRAQQAVLERASRDLVGTKQGFYVIFGLAIMVPIFLVASQPEYLMRAFDHPWIKYVMQGAMVAQIICLVLFKRFTSLRV
jgi:tight adherence protein B